MIVRKLRLQRGWSQDQLAEIADVSVRTIQRAERGHKLSLDTANAFAAVFEVDISTFNYTEEQSMNQPANIQEDEERAMAQAKSVKDFIEEIVTFIIIFVIFAIIFGLQEPLMYLVFLGIGVGLLVQGMFVFEIIRFPTTNFERWVAEKFLGRKL